MTAKSSTNTSLDAFNSLEIVNSTTVAINASLETFNF